MSFCCPSGFGIVTALELASRTQNSSQAYISSHIGDNILMTLPLQECKLLLAGNFLIDLAHLACPELLQLAANGELVAA